MPRVVGAGGRPRGYSRGVPFCCAGEVWGLDALSAAETCTPGPAYTVQVGKRPDFLVFSNPMATRKVKAPNRSKAAPGRKNIVQPTKKVGRPPAKHSNPDYV
jgi:hypothetical protein